MLNKKQLIALWIGVLLFIAAGLYPPWLKVKENARMRKEEPMGWSWLWQPYSREYTYMATVPLYESDSPEAISQPDMFADIPPAGPAKTKQISRTAFEHGNTIDLVRLSIELLLITSLTLALVLSLAGKQTHTA